MPTLNLRPASTEDYRRLAEKRLPRALFDYIDGGAYDEATLKANVADLRALKLKQRVMRDVSQVDTKFELFGESWAMPLALAPIGLGGMMARRAELQAVRAANTFGIPFTLSTVAICSMEEVAKEAKRPFWYQLYMMRDRGHVTELLDRARAAGCKTLVFTVDLAVVGARYRDVRNGMAGGVGMRGRFRAGALDYALHPKWALDVGLRGKPHTFGNLVRFVPKATVPAEFKTWVDAQFDASVTWKDIAWLRSVWPGNLVIKGILSPEDAGSAADVSADAIVVSNHGGRQLDGVSSTIAMLPRVVEKVGALVPVLLDSGVRSGLDVVRALALGAKAALIGRAWIWAIAAQGEKGLLSLLYTMRGEMRVGMALTGTASLAEVNGDVLDRSG